MIAPLFDPASYSFSLYAVPTLITAAAILLLGLLVLVRERVSLVSVSFALVTGAVSIWLFATSLVYCSTDPSVALWWAKAGYLGIPFIVPTTYQFTLVVLRIFKQYEKLVWLSWAIAGFFSACALWTDALVGGLYQHWWGYYSRYNWMGLPFQLFFFSMFMLSMYHYWTEYRKAEPGRHKLRIRLFMIAWAAGYIASVDYVATYGVPVYPFGYLSIAAFLVIASVAIWKYHLVDITPAFAANQIINTMDDALLVLDRDGVVRLVNPAAQRLFGTDLVGRPAASSLDAPLFSQDWAEMLDSGKSCHYEMECHVGDEARTLSLSASVTRNDQHEPLAVVCLARDITEHMLADEALKKESSFVALLQAVAMAANEAQTIEEAMQICLDEVCALTGWPVGHGYLLMQTSSEDIISADIRHLDDPARFEPFYRATRGLRFSRGFGLPGQVLASGKPVWMRDVSSDDDFMRWRAAQETGLKSAFAFPILTGSEVVGVLEFFATQVVEPDEALMEVMAHIGTQLGRVVERKRAEKILVESELKFRSVTQSASDAIISADSSGNIIFWNNGALDIFGYTEEETLGRPLTMLMPERYRQGHVEGMARVNTTGKTHVIGKTAEMHGLHKDGSEFPIELSLATWTTGEDTFYSGVIRDITERKEAEAEIRRLNEDLERRVFERTMQIAIANRELENEIAERRRAEQALVHLATHDELTGLYNRREMNRILIEEINRCMRYEHHLSLVMLDIDHFKSINDTHGHQVGDDVLRWIAGLLSGSLRVTDKLAHYESLHNLARYGGEEFAAILPETEEGDAFTVAERIRQAVAAQPFSYTGMEGERVEIAVTISVGVASLSDEVYSDETLIKAADDALYEAKRSGRNRTERARTGSPMPLLIQNALYEQPSTMLDP